MKLVIQDAPALKSAIDSIVCLVEEGQFELRVDFPEAPYAQAFTVKVKSLGQKRYFEFVSYGNPPEGGGEGGGEPT